MTSLCSKSPLFHGPSGHQQAVPFCHRHVGCQRQIFCSLQSVHGSARLLRPRCRASMRTRGSVCISSAAAGGTNEQASPVADQLEGEQLTHWKSAVEQVVAVGFDEDQAARHLERAFGWRSQVFWRGLKKEEVPDPGQVSKTLKYLTVELGLKDTDIQAAITKFPEGLASGVEDRLQPNMEVLQKQFYMPKKNLAAAVKRQPKALGFSYDCEGSCEGECHRCWVRF